MDEEVSKPVFTGPKFNNPNKKLESENKKL